MSMTEVKGKEILIKYPPYTIYMLFTDLKNFVANLPEEHRDKVTADSNSLTAKIQGFTLGVKIVERHPYSFIRLTDDGASPLKFTLQLNFTPVGLDSTLFNMDLALEMSPMVKMMIGGRLQEMIDKLSDQIESAVNTGKMPDMNDLTSF